MLVYINKYDKLIYHQDINDENCFIVSIKNINNFFHSRLVYTDFKFFIDSHLTLNQFIENSSDDRGIYFKYFFSDHFHFNTTQNQFNSDIIHIMKKIFELIASEENKTTQNIKILFRKI
ncbi:hypothetical protein [Campylobacter sp. 2457A]|uniref:hypothetical protein n=1 Tax=Campylobacter sp. 2457A TaxID=2735784 RepID=UPI00301C89B3|nr:hypothetical protein [Campylobacter sp. 2457A]